MVSPSFETGYRALQQGTTWRDQSERGKVSVTGADRITFLHSMISNDVSGLAEYQGRYGTFLTSTGKVVADFYYYRLPEQVLIDLSPTTSSNFIATLEQYIIMDEVALHDVSVAWRHFSIQGPGSREFLTEIVDVSPPEQLGKVQPCNWEGHEILWIRRDELSTPGYEILLPADGGTDFASLLDESRAIEIGLEVYDVARLERGIPLFGRDVTGKNNPLEARLDEAVSLSKGCYIGQEVIARATHIGGVPRLLTKLLLEGVQVPEGGSRVLTPDGKEAGKVTSAAYSPRLEKVIALAYIKRALIEEGARMSVDAGQDRISVKVVDRFS